MQTIYNDLHTTLDDYYISAVTDDSSPLTPVRKPITYCVSAMCGSGKTIHLANAISKHISDPAIWKHKNFVYACQSIDLMEQFEDMLEQRGLSAIHKFNSDDDNNVFRQVKDYILNGDHADGGHVVLITHVTYLRAAHFINRDDWSVYIDEIPQIIECDDPNIEYSSLWLRHVITGKQYNSDLIELIAKEHEAVERYKASHDAGVKPFHKLLHALTSKTHRCFATVESYRYLMDVAVEPVAENDTQLDHQFNYTIQCEPSVFNGVTILGANIPASMVYDFLVRNGHDLIPDETLAATLDYILYPESVSKRIRVECILDRRYSITLGEKRTSDNRTVKSEMDERAIKRLGDKPFLLLSNVKDRGALKKHPNVIRLPSKPQGLNQYRTHNIVVCMVAYAHKPAGTRMLRALGYSNQSIRHSILVEPVHQAIMRTSARDRDATDEVLVILTDKYIADEIVQMIGCANAIKIAGTDISPVSQTLAERTYPALTKVQMNQRSKTSKYFSDMGLNRSTDTTAVISAGYNDLNSIDNKHPVEMNSHISQTAWRVHAGQKGRKGTKSPIRNADEKHDPDEHQFTFTFHNTKTDCKPEQFGTDTFTCRKLVDCFRMMHSTVCVSKGERRMYNPAVFEQWELGSGFRTKVNWLSASAMVLDFDGGEVSPEDFIRLFHTDCTDAEKMSFLIYNSFSRSETDPNRFHVVIPYQVPIFELAVHHAIFDFFQDRLARSGFPPETSGMDKNLRNGVQSVYCPCTNVTHQDAAFLKWFGMEKKQFKKYGLNPIGFKASISRLIVSKKNPISASQRPATPYWDEVSEQELMQEVEALHAMTDGRHMRFYRLARRLWWSGRTRHEALAVMLYVAKGESDMIKKAHHNTEKAYE